MACDMTGGSSGGPWVVTSDPTKYAGTILSSLNSYGYSGVKKMYGPKFNTDTQAVFRDADAGTSRRARPCGWSFRSFQAEQRPAAGRGVHPRQWRA